MENNITLSLTEKETGLLYTVLDQYSEQLGNFDDEDDAEAEDTLDSLMGKVSAAANGASSK